MYFCFCHTVEFFYGVRGGLNLRLGSHSFYRHTKTRGNAHRWSCTSYSRKCKAHLIITDTLNVLKAYTEHNHPPVITKENDQKEIEQKTDGQDKTTTSDTQKLEHLVEMLTGVTKHGKDSKQYKKVSEDKCVTSLKQDEKKEVLEKKQITPEKNKVDKVFRNSKVSEHIAAKLVENLKNYSSNKSSNVQNITTISKEDGSDEDVIEVDVRSQPFNRKKTAEKKQIESLERSGDSVVHVLDDGADVSKRASKENSEGNLSDEDDIQYSGTSFTID